MEIVYIILLFIAPGVIVYAIEEFSTLSNHKSANKTIYENLFGIVMHSSIVSITSIALATDGLIKRISDIIIMLDSFTFFIKYAAIMMAVVMSWSCLYINIISKILFYLRNVIYGGKYGIKKGKRDNLTVLQSVLFKSRQEHIFVSIYKGGVMVAAGELREWNQSLEDPMEWKLYHTNTVRRVLKEDESKAKEDKLLHKVDFEVYDMDKDLLIKFHNNMKILEHWQDI